MRLKVTAIAMLVAGLCTHHANAVMPCDADLDGSGTVNGLDLGIFLAQWAVPSYAPCPPFRTADFDHDCDVDGIDLAQMLAGFGPLPGFCFGGGVITDTQLAGNSLAQYPFFEYVRDFNQGANIQVAIDPTRFPAIVGQTCRVYVVNKQTPAQWTSSPALVDVTSGGFQVQTFAAGTIQANTFTISGGSALNGTTGTQIGVGYDMVCDCNQNGTLDGGDFIDGRSVEAGLYVVRDTAAAGPNAVTATGNYSVGAAFGIVAGQQFEQAFYPSGIAGMGQLPLIVCSHGNGHNYQWYNHIGNHMASYGYIVMSHQNNTVPGIDTASLTTLQHTDAFISQQATIGGGAMNGHINTNQIVWIGHSRGAEGVARAYDRLFDMPPSYTPTGYSINSIKVVSSIAPTDFLGPNSSHAHNANYHLWTGQSDADVNGCANCDLCQTFHLHDRPTDYRQSVSITGAGHGDFHNGAAGSVAAGPCLIGRAKTIAIMRGYFLPLVKRYLENDIPSKDFLWRQWERFRPIGAPADAVCNPPSGSGVDVNVNLMYRDSPSAGNFMIDDYQTGLSTGTSTSGGTVLLAGLVDVIRNRADDADATFTWLVADLMNGMTVGGPSDTTRAIAFTWNGPASYEQQIVPAQQNFSDDVYLSFRACQVTQHPNTAASLGDTTFDIVLRDTTGNTSRINIGAYGGGLEEPYQRTGCGGTGWANEFEVIRIRLTDFLNNGSMVNLSSIAAVRFEFGGAGTSATGRIGLDEIEVTKD